MLFTFASLDPDTISLSSTILSLIDDLYRFSMILWADFLSGCFLEYIGSISSNSDNNVDDWSSEVDIWFALVFEFGVSPDNPIDIGLLLSSFNPSDFISCLTRWCTIVGLDWDGEIREAELLLAFNAVWGVKEFNEL